MARKRVRFEWVEMRLEIWGEWSLTDGGLGAKVMNYSEAIGSTNYRDYSPRIGFAHRERETHRAIQDMGRREWEFILEKLHIEGKKPAEIAEMIGKSERFVNKEYELILSNLEGRLSALDKT
jgi:hypothetical protein